MNSASHQFPELLNPGELIQKRLEIEGRGLNTFPVPSSLDLKAINRLSDYRKSLSDGGWVALPHLDLSIPLHSVVTDELLYYLLINDYEKSDLDLIAKSVRKGDRVVDVGGGIGLCAAVMARLAGNEVVVVEAQPQLIPVIQQTLSINGLAGQVINAVMSGAKDETLEFGVSDNLWFSSLDMVEDASSLKIQVKTIGLAEVCDRFRPDVLLMDIEGAEASLDFPGTPWLPRDLIVEIHTPSFGGEVTCNTIQNIVDAGYRIVDVKSQSWLFTKKA